MKLLLHSQKTDKNFWQYLTKYKALARIQSNRDNHTVQQDIDIGSAQ